jgi:hypothetical protein
MNSVKKRAVNNGTLGLLFPFRRELHVLEEVETNEESIVGIAPQCLVACQYNEWFHPEKWLSIVI